MVGRVWHGLEAPGVEARKQSRERSGRNISLEHCFLKQVGDFQVSFQPESMGLFLDSSESYKRNYKT